MSLKTDKKMMRHELELCSNYMSKLEAEKYSTGRTPHIAKMHAVVYRKSLAMIRAGDLEELPLFYLRSLMGQTNTQSTVIRIHDLFAKNLSGEVDDSGWDHILDTLYTRRRSFFKATRFKKSYTGMETMIYALREHKPARKKVK